MGLGQYLELYPHAEYILEYILRASGQKNFTASLYTRTGNTGLMIRDEVFKTVQFSYSFGISNPSQLLEGAQLGQC